MGVSVEQRRYTWRIDALRQTGAYVKFLSLEPLLGPLPDLDLQGIDWVIVGGESGPGARPMDPVWVLEVRDQCQRAHIPFFFKQWGGVHKKQAGRLLEGHTWDEMPALPWYERGWQRPMFDDECRGWFADGPHAPLP
jgi:protein gp37